MFMSRIIKNLLTSLTYFSHFAECPRSSRCSLSLVPASRPRTRTAHQGCGGRRARGWPARAAGEPLGGTLAVPREGPTAPTPPASTKFSAAGRQDAESRARTLVGVEDHRSEVAAGPAPGVGAGSRRGRRRVARPEGRN